MCLTVARIVWQSQMKFKCNFDGWPFNLMLQCVGPCGTCFRNFISNIVKCSVQKWHGAIHTQTRNGVQMIIFPQKAKNTLFMNHLHVYICCFLYFFLPSLWFRRFDNAFKLCQKRKCTFKIVIRRNPIGLLQNITETTTKWEEKTAKKNTIMITLCRLRHKQFTFCYFVILMSNCWE